jgi:hypothetical protein
MSNLKLSWGRRSGLPEGLEAAWGARLIWPNDLVWDRQDMVGSAEQRKQLGEWLNGGPLRWTLERLSNIEGHYGGLQPSEDREIALYDDGIGKIVGSPQGSHGYLYVAAWLFEHISA